MASSTPASSAAQLRQICGVGQCWGPTSRYSVPWGVLQPSSSLVQVPMRRWHTLQALPGITGFTWQEPSLSSLRPVCRTNPCRLWMRKADTHFKSVLLLQPRVVPAQPQVAVMQGQQNSSPLCPVRADWTTVLLAQQCPLGSAGVAPGRKWACKASCGCQDINYRQL